MSRQLAAIYSQAAAAEAYGLDQVAGVGYRKALGFLVKDYCISKNPKRAEEIKGEFLGNCINDHIDDPRLKECARRATWLGNDETHYLRKWKSKDINDLKVLTDLTISWIRTNVLTDRYLREMKPNKPKGYNQTR